MWKEIFLVILLMFIGKNYAFSIEDTLNRCCTNGEEWARNENECSAWNERIEEVPLELQPICISTTQICCSRYHRFEQCNLGQTAARMGKDCLPENNTFSPESYKDCCESCKIGLIVGSGGYDNCSLSTFQFGSPLDESYELCCNSMKDEYYFVGVGEKLCAALGAKLCEQICVDTKDSYMCACEKGFVLQEDKFSCAKQSDNEISDLLPDCPKGYYFNEMRERCEDIDECETGIANCDVDTEICYNHPGSHMCIAKAAQPDECDEGFRYNVKKEICEDINECLEEIHECDKESQICINQRGGYKCKDILIETCPNGLTFDTILQKCMDINECLEEDICDEGYVCNNTYGSFECIKKKITKPPISDLVNPILPQSKLSCASGYIKKGDICVDINECIVDKNACDSYQNCINFPGGFRCECKIGFTYDVLRNACIDVNECQINLHECLDTQRCDNTIGSYNCIRLQGCGTGYTLNAATGQCEDDDECILGTHNCQPPYECRNTVGSFRCHRAKPTTTVPSTIIPSQYSSSYIPSAGYYTHGDGPCDIGFERNVHGACADVNECDQAPCRRNEKCINTNGSYKCQSLLQCSGGYTSNENGTQCVDIDECETGEATCGPDQLCRNKPGGYICYCPPGHMLNKDKRCEDVDECASYQVCPVNAECINTIGSFICECKPGFRRHQDEEKRCDDIDECVEQTGLCQQKCINYWGSYRCACDPGYNLSPNNRTCDDIDECEIHKTYNLCMGICENVPGSYACRCPSGYTLGADGRSCQDIDECADGRVCHPRNEICTNTKGSYRCTRIECPAGYIRDTERINRCKRISLTCTADDLECFKKPTAYSFNFITVVADMSIPPQGRALFNFKGPNWFENIDFDFRVVKVQAPPDVQKANEQFFAMQKINNEALLSLMRTLQGPQDIELELSMTVYRNRQPSGTNVAKIFILVSEYPY